MAPEKTPRPGLSPLGYTPEEEAVHKELMEMGLLTEVRPRTKECKMDRPVGRITGKPLSETVIEDRR